MRRDIFIHNIQSHRKSHPASSGSVDSPREPFRVRPDSPGGSLAVQSKNEGVCEAGNCQQCSRLASCGTSDKADKVFNLIFFPTPVCLASETVHKAYQNGSIYWSEPAVGRKRRRREEEDCDSHGVSDHYEYISRTTVAAQNHLFLGITTRPRQGLCQDAQHACQMRL
jgi:hypothetical protein